MTPTEKVIAAATQLLITVDRAKPHFPDGWFLDTDVENLRAALAEAGVPQAKKGWIYDSLYPPEEPLPPSPPICLNGEPVHVLTPAQITRCSNTTCSMFSGHAGPCNNHLSSNRRVMSKDDHRCACYACQASGSPVMVEGLRPETETPLA